MGKRSTESWLAKKRTRSQLKRTFVIRLIEMIRQVTFLHALCLLRLGLRNVVLNISPCTRGLESDGYHSRLAEFGYHSPFLAQLYMIAIPRLPLCIRQKNIF